MSSKQFLFNLIFFAALVGCNQATDQIAPHPFDVAWEDLTLFRNGLVSSEQVVLDQSEGMNVYHMDVVIDKQLESLTGRQEVLYTNREEISLGEIVFRLFPNTAGGQLNVLSAEVNGAEVEPSYTLQDSALQIPLATPLKSGEQVEIGLNYELFLPIESGGNYGLLGSFEDVLLFDTFYPVIPVYDENGWNIEIPPTNGDVNFFDASLYLVRITAPKKLDVVASGIEIGHQVSKGQQILTLAAGPARDFYFAAANDLSVISETAGETTINSYAFFRENEGAETALRTTIAALTSFNDRFGPYPYTELDLVSIPMQALGIEYPGIVGLAKTMYDPEAEIQGLPSQVLLESVVAHEIAHQWFYNLVGSDQVDEPWVDEAVTQVATGLYYQDTYGEEVAERYRDSWYDRWNRIDAEEIPIGLPSAAYTQEAYSPIIYGRGPIFVSELAKKMDQDTFDAFLKDYVQQNRWGIASGKEFRQLAETHCRCDLSALFEQWLLP